MRDAGRQHGEKGKEYGMTGPDDRGRGKWQPDAKHKCFYETGDEKDRCYVTEKGGPKGQKKRAPHTDKGDWKTYEKQRWRTSMLRQELIRIAHENPEMRKHILPLLRQGSHQKKALKQNQFRVLMGKGGSFGVLSAYGSFPKHENQKRHGELVADLQKMGYRKMHPVKGQWEGVGEKSVLVPNIKPEDLFKLGEKYKQDATIYKSKSGIVGMYNRKGKNAEVAVDPSANPAFEMSEGTDLFSKDRNWSFEFGFLWGEKVPWDGRHPIGPKQVQQILLRQKTD